MDLDGDSDMGDNKLVDDTEDDRADSRVTKRAKLDVDDDSDDDDDSDEETLFFDEGCVRSEDEATEFWRALRKKIELEENWVIGIGFIGSYDMDKEYKEEALKKMKECYGHDVVYNGVLDEYQIYTTLVELCYLTYRPEEDMYSRLFISSGFRKASPPLSTGLENDKKFLKLFSVLEKANLDVESLPMGGKEAIWAKADEVAKDAGLCNLNMDLISECVETIYKENSRKASFQTRETTANQIVDCYYKKIGYDKSSTLGSDWDKDCARKANYIFYSSGLCPVV